MGKVVGAPTTIAVVIRGVDRGAAAGAPAPTGPIPAGLPSGRTHRRHRRHRRGGTGARRSSALPADDNAVVSIPGTTKTFTRGSFGLKGNDGLVSRGSSRVTPPDVARFGKQGVRQCTLSPPGRLRAARERSDQLLSPDLFRAADEHFRDGLRKSADPRKANTNNMIGFAKATTREEDLAARSISRSSRILAASRSSSRRRRRMAPGRNAHGRSGQRGRRDGANLRRRDRRDPGRQPAS